MTDAVVGLIGVALGGALSFGTGWLSDERRRRADLAAQRMRSYPHVLSTLDEIHHGLLHVLTHGAFRAQVDARMPELDLLNELHLLGSQAVRAALGPEHKARQAAIAAAKRYLEDPSTSNGDALDQAIRARLDAHNDLITAMRADVGSQSGIAGSRTLTRAVAKVRRLLRR